MIRPHSVPLQSSFWLLNRLISPVDRPEATAVQHGDDVGWRNLGRDAQVYVACVIAVGVVWAAAHFPMTVPRPILFVTLLAASCVTSIWKVTLPLPTGNGSTLSVSYAANLAALLLLGPHLAMVVAAAGAWTQCTVAAQRPYPLYRTVFSTAAAVITIQATGLTYGWLGGETVPVDLAELSKPLLVAIATYFVVNTGLVAGAIALS